MKRKIYFADLTHTAQGISASSFPLGISYVVSYATKMLGQDFETTLFKFPKDLVEALTVESPSLLCFSNYSWNFELSYKIASLAKARNPNLITVFGGPNFPTVQEEKEEFLLKRPNLDFYIELEGELGFVDLVKELQALNLDAAEFKSKELKTLNVNYINKGKLVAGRVERIKEINDIPSPYLTGVLDHFFTLPLTPMIETTRGCPFTCTFCADGLAIKGKIKRYEKSRVRDELYYIAEHVNNVDELVITDLNFAMYPEDLETARVIAEIKDKYGYPIILGASAGKNMPMRTIETAKILKGMWTLGASIQSTDKDVLVSIKRQNISNDAYKQLITFGNSLKNSKTHSEIILGLPGDTKEKHFESLRFGIENECNSIRMFQAMLLPGTEMAAGETRRRYGLKTKYRIIPGCTGIYEFFGKSHPVAEIEEIIVGSNTLSEEDYLDCRIMNLLIETFHNNAVFLELFSMVTAIGASEFDCIKKLFEHPEWYPPRIAEIISEFKRHTMKDLYDSFEEANNYVLTPEIIEKYIGGELGTNELLLHRALLFKEFETITDLIFKSVREVLKAGDKLNDRVDEYLEELRRFVILRKKLIFEDCTVSFEQSFNFDFVEIQEKQFAVNPNELIRLDSPIKYRFYHDGDQQRHINNQKNLYSQTPVGLGKLIQRSNLKLMYRQFEEQPHIMCDHS